ncbi:MAG: urease accessory protein UreD [Pseudomonadota bacterium]
MTVAETEASTPTTTPAATKFYRSNGFDAGFEQQLRLAAGARCEWLPLENLVFDGARVRSRLRVELAAGARFLGQEVWGLGRPARGERFECGQLAQRFQLTVAGRPLLTEQLVLDGGDVLARSPWGLNGQDAFGALYAYPVDREFATAQARRDGAAQAWGARSCGTRIAQSWVDELLIVRGTSTSLEALRRCLEREWVALRPHVIGLSAMRPRIWNT